MMLDELENHQNDFTRSEVAAHLRSELGRIGIQAPPKLSGEPT